MQPIPSTAEILALKVLSRDIDQVFVDWATDMIVVGFNTPHLNILAGMTAPFNQFEIRELTDKAFNELHLDLSDPDRIIKEYIKHIVDKTLKKELTPLAALGVILHTLGKYNNEKYQDEYYDFYLLDWAQDDLLYREYQYYWPEMTRDNVEATILNYFKKWKEEYETKYPKL